MRATAVSRLCVWCEAKHCFVMARGARGRVLPGAFQLALGFVFGASDFLHGHLEVGELDKLSKGKAGQAE